MAFFKLLATIFINILGLKIHIEAFKREHYILAQFRPKMVVMGIHVPITPTSSKWNLRPYF